MTDHYRIDKELMLAGIFLLLLVLFAGWTGVRAVLSFIDTILLMWKVLVPCLLRGWNPVWVALGLVVVLTGLILSLIYGFERRCLAAASGAVLGIGVTAVLGIVFTDLFQIHGAVMESSESLLYAGYQHLDLTQIFMASIFLGSSGAVMDLSVDVCSAVYEVVQKRPDIGTREAISSGFAVGRAACGLHNHHTAAGLLRKLYRAFNGIYGPGDASGVHFELQVRGRGDCPHDCGLFRSGDSGASHCHHQRSPADENRSGAGRRCLRGECDRPMIFQE